MAKGERIEDVNISSLCKELITIYGANVNIARHIPLINDSLKPVERRIIYTMYLRKASTSFKKVATIIGSTMDMFHPHGDLSIHGTIARLAQSWNNNIPLIEGQGNFGSIAGDSAGAARYIEARLSPYAIKCFFEDFEESLVDVKPSYSGEYREPEFLPCRYPNILVNSVPGIGYGLAMGIPTYNFKEVVDLAIKLIKNPDEDCFLIPDLPTGCDVIDQDQFQEICDTGRGKFMMRGNAKIIEDKHMIHITSVPYQVDEGQVKSTIIKLQDEGKIAGIKGIEDNTTESTVDLRIFVKPEIDPYALLKIIYTKTLLQKTMGVQFKLIDDYQDKDHNMKSILLDWIDGRRLQKRRQFGQNLSKLKNRQHILEILLFILNKNNAEKTLKIIKASENAKDIVIKLVDAYGITTLQAKSISEMKLYAFGRDYMRKYNQEYKDITKSISELETILLNAHMVDDIIIEELKEGIKLFGTPRRSKVVTLEESDNISNTDHIILFTKLGFIKKLPSKSTNIGSLTNGDNPIGVFKCNNRDTIMIYDDLGKTVNIDACDIPSHEYTSVGDELRNFANIKGLIVKALVKPKDKRSKEPVYLLFVSKNGSMKRTEISKFDNVRAASTAIKLRDDDYLIDVKLIKGNKDILVYTTTGKAIRFSTDEVREAGRSSMGVSSYTSDDVEDKIHGIDIIRPEDKFIMALTTRGVGKKCRLRTFVPTARNGELFKIIGLDSESEIAVVKTVKGDEVFKVYSKNTVQEISVKDIVELPRLSNGKKIVPLARGNYIVDIKEKNNS